MQEPVCLSKAAPDLWMNPGIPCVDLGALHETPGILHGTPSVSQGTPGVFPGTPGVLHGTTRATRVYTDFEFLLMSSTPRTNKHPTWFLAPDCKPSSPLASLCSAGLNSSTYEKSPESFQPHGLLLSVIVRGQRRGFRFKSFQSKPAQACS